ncbi:hypothetical protein J2T60_002152 [Natronospira proteinivora]|uniref:Cation/multidrug efflux pump n=1 Tax=Natronospira proteinivora TaxID=1807133 RepID=A0ABT1GDY1_9GAMM|nr:hypothetical protein [Natronospira proteinivora]MCP1728152.1 hypothetical protein [Natronospira proteinivora]
MPGPYALSTLIALGAWLILAVGALGLLLSGLKGLWHRHLAGGSFKICCSAVVGGFAAALAGIGLVLHTYDRLTHEQAAVTLHFEELASQQYRANLSFPDGQFQSLELHGDQWQVDARILRWTGPAIIAGMDALFRMERISGRFADLGREREGPRSIHALPSGLAEVENHFDPWALARRHPNRFPWVDAVYGSATYLPMAHDAEFEVVVTQTGLAARPLNDSARRAIRDW